MQKELNTIRDRIFTIIGTILCLILTPILIVNTTLIAKSYINQDEVPSIGGYFPLIVLTDSMYPEIEGGDLVICNTIDSKDVKKGDIISFFDPAGNGTSIVTHRVVEIIEENGEIYFRTKGDNNNAEDRMLVTSNSLVGVYKTSIAGVGNIAMFMQSTTGLVLCVIFPIVGLVSYDFIRRKIYEKKHQDDTTVLLAELEALRAEKAALSNKEAN